MDSNRKQIGASAVTRQDSGRTTASSLCIAAGVFAVLGAAAANAQSTIQVPALESWNDSNALTVGPDSAANGRTYLYPDAATRNLDEANTQEGVGSRAHLNWDIDTGLGEPPGIQVVTQDLDFPLRNCIIASGTDATSGEEKTCSDPQGSAKRFRLTLTEADEPVDLVFNTAVLDKVYDESIDVDTVEVGRIYRLIQKLVNDTGERVQGFRVEVGFGTGDDFEPASFAEDDVAFELRSLVHRRFFGEADTQLPDYIDAHDDPDADCAACHDDVDALETRREVWFADEYATFSPKMFDILEGGRFIDRAGYFDDEIAGLVPPQKVENIAAEKTQFIASGDNVDGATGIIGPTTPNYFDLPNNQAAGSGMSGNIFGYLLPDSMLTSGIYEDRDGDPATEGELVAWWDGSDWRWGNERGFGVVPQETLSEWAKRPLSEFATLAPPRYEVAPIDDLSALNLDTFLYIGEDFDTGEHPTVTVRYEATPITDNTSTGTETPPWERTSANEAPDLSTYVEGDGDGLLGCTYNPGAPFDPLLPGLLAGALGVIAWRGGRRRGSTA